MMPMSGCESLKRFREISYSVKLYIYNLQCIDSLSADVLAGRAAHDCAAAH
jgi:hypothetical protein